MEDRDIVALYWGRQERAIRETQRKYGPYLTAIAQRLLGDPQDTEECVQDTYQAAWDSIPPQQPQILSAYLAKLTRRIAMKRWRSRDTQKRGRGEIPLSLDELGDCIPAPTDAQQQLEAKELARSIDAFLAQLSAEERGIFLRRYFHGATIREICKTSGYSKSKIESQLHRTRQKLKAHLQKEGYIHDR